jgi:hypothetical protein
MGDRELWYSDTRGQQHRLELIVRGTEMKWRDKNGMLETITWVKVK